VKKFQLVGRDVVKAGFERSRKIKNAERIL